jgi:hypothetical protein
MTIALLFINFSIPMPSGSWNPMGSAAPHGHNLRSPAIYKNPHSDGYEFRARCLRLRFGAQIAVPPE